MDDALKLLLRNQRQIELQSNQEILEWISEFNPGNDHARVLEKTQTDGLFSNTCQWLLEHPFYRAWTAASDENRTVLSIQGPIGTGKTTIMSRIIETLLVTSNLSGTSQVAFFYCSGSYSTGSPTKDIIRGLLRQLAFAADGVQLLEAVQLAAKDARKDNGAREYITYRTCLELLQNCLDAHGEVLFVIDALDECAEWEVLLDELSNIQRNSTGTLKFCFSSRPEVSVSTTFPNVQSIYIDEAQTNLDLWSFVEQEVLRKGKPLLKDREGDLEKRLISALYTKAEGMYV
jgi:hypothetical protein